MNLLDRLKDGGARWEWDGDELVVYVDGDEILDTDVIDTPEVEVIRIHKSDMKKAASKAWKDVKAEAVRAGKNIRDEWRRFQKRRKAARK